MQMTLAANKMKRKLGDFLIKRPWIFKTLKRCISGAFHSSSVVTDLQSTALYVHWPFCKRRCTYCNFNKYISESVDHERMRQCLQKETETLINGSTVKTVTSVFFGGGTPSLAEPNTLAAVLETAASVAALAPDTEVSMEINPTSMETDKLRDFKAAGINRASIGIQTLDNNGLKILGRDHTCDDSLRCLEAANKIFDGVTSVDLIFGYPGQTLHMWRNELEQVLPASSSHVSLYQLTLERGTSLFKDVAAGSTILPSAEEVAEMYQAAIEILSSHGFQQYEISNFAKEDKFCRHNVGYWTGQQYVGVGPGSHSRLWRQKSADGPCERFALVQTLEPLNWMWEVEKFGHATRKTSQQTAKTILEELLAVSLRTKWGLSHQNWSALASTVPLSALVNSSRTQFWVQNGFILVDPGGLRATPHGLMILDSILPDLLIDADELFSAASINRNN